MLDNPNLGLEEMQKVMALGTEIIGVALLFLIAILIYIYRYEISLFIKYGFPKNKKGISPMRVYQLLKTDFSELEKKDFNSKIDNLLQKFEKPMLDDEDNNLIKNVDKLILSKKSEHSPPIFRNLKIVKTSNEILYHFVNDGGAIHNFKIYPRDGFMISVEPQKKIEVNESGYIKIKFENNNVVNEVSFDLSYYDEKHKFQKERYKFTV